MKHVIFLPVENPPDPVNASALCGDVPVEARALRYQRMVWYDRADVDSAVAQIAALGVDSVILAGFSKSGPGAIQVALRIPEIVRGLLIFDAPFAMPALGGNDPASARAESLARAMHDALHPSTRIVLIGGEHFHEEMRGFGGLLTREAVPHDFIDQPGRAHRWDSGWVREGLKDILNEENWGGNVPTV
jgi:pimeloyl-ACP methyl ester carboxylesterase